MRKPTEAEMETALAAAERMWSRDVDPHELARTVLFLSERNKELEALLERVDRFLRFGMPETELSRLRRQVAKLLEKEIMEEGDQESSMLV